MTKRSLSKRFTRAINLVVFLYYTRPPPPLPIENLFISGDPLVEWSQCRKSHDHRWKITRDPVCWTLEFNCYYRSHCADACEEIVFLSDHLLFDTIWIKWIKRIIELLFALEIVLNNIE